jgi:hypothetical protein
MPNPKPPAPNPAKPFTEVTIDGTTYKMCFTYAALAHAEDILTARGYDINIVRFMLKRNFSTTREVFVASLLEYQPELFPGGDEERGPAIDKLLGLVREDTILEILVAVDAAWKQSTPEQKPLNP